MLAFSDASCYQLLGEITSTFDHPEAVTLGECKLIDEIMIGEDKLIRFSGPKSGDACRLVNLPV